MGRPEEPPEIPYSDCIECNSNLEGSENEALENGVFLCDNCYDKFDEKSLKELEEKQKDIDRQNSGYSCEVCHKPLLQTEVDNFDPCLCEDCDPSDLKSKTKEYEEQYREDEYHQYKK